MQDWEVIINDLDNATDLSVDAFIGRLDAISKQMYEEIVQMASSLNYEATTSAQMVENLKTLNKINSKIGSLLQKTDYKEATTDFIKSFEKSQRFINLYYSTIVTGFEPSQDLFKTMLKANVETTSEMLIGSGIDANFNEPIKRLLQDVINGRGSYMNMKQSLSNYILGNKNISPRLKSYVGQVASDSVRQFQRNYMNAISSDLGLKHYLYRGTAITDTRKFCSDRVGRVFTETEVKSWASTSWKGKASGTNSSTIFTYVGGYNCRHTLLPISENIYNSKI